MTCFALTCLVISLILYAGYITYIYIKYKPDCISRSYYLLKNKYIFTIWIILVACLIFPAWVEISPIYFQFLPFLSVCSLAIVGLCPNYLDSDRIVHITAASVTCILSLIWNLVTGIYLLPILFCIILTILYALKAKNGFFWTENLAFLNIYLSILLS